jgi:riboflavin kinase / FMN adenylyltransferase
MLVLRGLEAARFSGVALTIGNFDGVHLGHQALLAAGRRRADAAGAQLVAMTFDPHPAALLSPDRVPPTLTPLPEKLRCLAAASVDVAVVISTTPEFLSLSAADFEHRVIVERFRPTAVIEGDTFNYGQHRKGDIGTLREAGRREGFEVEVVGPVRVDLGGHPSTVISSSIVRHLLSSGNVDRAALALGRPYALFGDVIHGAGRGHELGFPTANLAAGSQLIPAEGVYAGRAFVLPAEEAHREIAPLPTPSAALPAAISIGRKPTFGDEFAIEAFLLDYSGDLYNRALRLDFLDWLRPQEKFSSAQTLCEAMDRDVARTREVFARAAR